MLVARGASGMVEPFEAPAAIQASIRSTCASVSAAARVGFGIRTKEE